MRYYEITITPVDDKPMVFKSTGATGSPIGSALRVDLDIYQQLYNQAGQNSFIRIYGVDYRDISKFANLNPRLPLTNPKNFARIEVKAGMSKGLPLAKPGQQGVLVNGMIGQAFANWQGNEVTLDIVIIPRIGSPDNPLNMSFNWQKGQTLEAAVRQTLQNNYTGVQIKGGYSKDLVYTEDQPAMYYDLEELATYVYRTSKSIIPRNDYPGATISFLNDTFVLSDGTVPADRVVPINYTDFIGNTTWLDVGTISAKLVMRGDLSINTRVQFPEKFPQTNVVTSFSQYRNKVSQPGEYVINQIHHIGSSRQSSADSWVTVINCVEPPK